MHNIKLIRKKPDFFLGKLKQRNTEVDLKNLLDLDKKNRNLIQNKENLEQDKKIISKKKDKSQFLRSKVISKKIDELNKSQLKIKNKIDSIICSLPNIALDDVPIGKDASSNKELKKSAKYQNLNLNHYHITKLAKI